MYTFDTKQPEVPQDAIKKGANWHGVWILRVVSDDGVEKLLVTARTRTSRNDIKIR